MPPENEITVIETLDSLYVYDQENAEWTKGWWNIFSWKNKNKSAAINISTLGDNTIIAAVGGKRLLITSIILTVAGEVNITLYGGNAALSGPMDFGGTSEPRGMVSNFGHADLDVGLGKAFIINLSGAVQVSGIVCYRVE